MSGPECCYNVIAAAGAIMYISHTDRLSVGEL